MRKTFKGNKLMTDLICSFSNNDDRKTVISLEELGNLMNKKIVKIVDTFILEDVHASIKVEAAEKNFDKLIKTYTDKTGYESACNEFRIVDYFPENLSVEEQWKIGLIVMENFLQKEDFPIPCIFYYGYDEGILTMRFHKYRYSEGLWLSEDLEGFNNPVAYYCVEKK